MSGVLLAPLVVVALKTSVLVACGSLVVRLLARSPAVVRHLVWLTVIVGSLLVPIVGRYARIRLPVLPAVTQARGDVLAPFARSGERAATPVSSNVALPSPDDPLGDAHAAPAVSVATIAVATWVVGACVLVFRLLLGVASIRRLIRRARLVDSDPWSKALATGAARLHVQRVPTLVMSDEVEVAFAFGIVRPVIILPAAASEWSDDRRSAVLMHELAHIRRRDLVAHVIAALSCAVYWFNPLVWGAARSLHTESELASDAIVVRAGVRASDYAQHLLDLVTSFNRRAPALGLAMARPKEFEGRLVAILDSQARANVVLPQLRAMVGGFAMMAVVIGAATPVRRETPPTPPPHLRALAAALPPLSSGAAPRTLAPRTEEGRRGHLGNDVSPAAPAVFSSYALASLARYGTGGIVNPMLMLLREGDSVGLSAMQADSIATLNRRYMVRLSGIWAPVAAYYSSSRANGDERSARSPVPDAPAQTIQALHDLLPAVNGLLTPDQRTRLSPGIAAYLDSATVASLPRAPDGVFVPANALSTLRGRGRGGG